MVADNTVSVGLHTEVVAEVIVSVYGETALSSGPGDLRKSRPRAAFTFWFAHRTHACPPGIQQLSPGVSTAHALHRDYIPFFMTPKNHGRHLSPARGRWLDGAAARSRIGPVAPATALDRGRIQRARRAAAGQQCLGPRQCTAPAKPFL